MARTRIPLPSYEPRRPISEGVDFFLNNLMKREQLAAQAKEKAADRDAQAAQADKKFALMAKIAQMKSSPGENPQLPLQLELLKEKILSEKAKREKAPEEIPETADEKSDRKVQEALKIETGKKNLTRLNELEKEMNTLVKSANHAGRAYDMLEENPNLTGPLQAGAVKAHLSTNEPLANFITNTKVMQAELGRLGSRVGGKYALKFAEGGKPNEWDQVVFNKGKLKGIHTMAKDDYTRLANEYRQISGKEPPVSWVKNKLEEHLSSDKLAHEKPGTVRMKKGSAVAYIPLEKLKSATEAGWEHGE